MTTATVNPNATVTWRLWHTLSLGVIVVALGLLGLVRTSLRIEGLWLATALLLLAFFLIAGKAATGQWVGLLIDQRNKMSLSRFQAVLWTLVILSAFLTAALWNLGLPPSETPDKPAKLEGALSIAVPEQIWALLGISTVSLIGSPLIKNRKREEQVSETVKEKREAELNAKTSEPVRVEGVLVENTTPERASWADLFKGEELGNAAYLDLGKTQMFFFTLLIVVAYIYLLLEIFGKGFFISAFPDVSGGMTALLGISHAGYLANKAIPHTSQTPG